MWPVGVNFAATASLVSYSANTLNLARTPPCTTDQILLGIHFPLSLSYNPIISGSSLRMVSKRHARSRKRMWLAWGVIALVTASGVAQESPPPAELSHDSSITVRHCRNPETFSYLFLSGQTSLTVQDAQPSSSHTSYKVTRSSRYIPFPLHRLSIAPSALLSGLACNPNLILCLAVPRLTLLVYDAALSVRSRFSK